MNIGGPTGSVGSNIPNPDNYEQGESSNPFNYGSRRSRITKKKNAHSHRRRQTANETFKPKNPLTQQLLLVHGYFLNIEYVTDKRKALDVWKESMVLSLINGPIYAEDGRDINVIHNLIVNSFQGIVYNYYTGISSNIRNLIEIDVKRNLRIEVEEWAWSIAKFLIGQLQRYEYVQHQENSKLEEKT